MGSALVFGPSGQPRQTLHVEADKTCATGEPEPPYAAPSLAYMIKGVEGAVATRKQTAQNLDKLARTSQVVQELRTQVRHASATRGELLALQLPHGVYLVQDGFAGRSERKPVGATGNAAQAGPPLYLEPLEAHHLRNDNDMQTLVDDLVKQLKQLEKNPNLVGASLTRFDARLRRDTRLNNGADVLEHGTRQAMGGAGACVAGAAHQVQCCVMNALLLAVSDAFARDGVLQRHPDDPRCRWPFALAALTCPVTAVILCIAGCSDDGRTQFFRGPVNGWYS